MHRLNHRPLVRLIEVLTVAALIFALMWVSRKYG